MSELILVCLMMLVTYLPRLLPFALASRLRLSKGLEKALSYVPIAVLSVIISQSIFYRDAELAILIGNPFIWASLIAFITALVQRRLFVTIFVGLLSYSIVKFAILA